MQTIPQSITVSLFKALSNHKRIAILKYLATTFATNKVIVKNTKIPQAQVSQALKRLIQVNLVEMEKVGTQKIYLVNLSEWKKVQHLVG